MYRKGGRLSWSAQETGRTGAGVIGRHRPAEAVRVRRGGARPEMREGSGRGRGGAPWGRGAACRASSRRATCPRRRRESPATRESRARRVWIQRSPEGRACFPIRGPPGHPRGRVVLPFSPGSSLCERHGGGRIHPGETVPESRLHRLPAAEVGLPGVSEPASPTDLHGPFREPSCAIGGKMSGAHPVSVRPYVRLRAPDTPLIGAMFTLQAHKTG